MLSTGEAAVCFARCELQLKKQNSPTQFARFEQLARVEIGAREFDTPGAVRLDRGSAVRARRRGKQENEQRAKRLLHG